ncbi:hypothetical protein BH23PLA1_BH23PLA1_34290 [soil metagenome]
MEIALDSRRGETGRVIDSSGLAMRTVTTPALTVTAMAEARVFFEESPARVYKVNPLESATRIDSMGRVVPARVANLVLRPLGRAGDTAD